jgi:hypothetical protein
MTEKALIESLHAKCVSLIAERDALAEQIDGWHAEQKENIKVAFDLQAEVNKLAAKLAELEKQEPAFYEFQWTNPGDEPNQPESMFVWARVEPRWNGTVLDKVKELEAYRYQDDKPTYRVRAIYTAPGAQSQDALRLDWLQQNFYSRENIDFITGKPSKTDTMWVFFAPTGTQGDIRRVLDAAMAQGAKEL